MKNLLFINACMRGERSRTLVIAKKFIETLSAKNEINIIERDLTMGDISFLCAKDFDETNGNINEDIPHDLAYEFAKADEIVIAAPFWEFEFPAVLSCYIETISKAKITFNYGENGSFGMCKADKLTYIYTAGDILSDDDKIGEKRLKRLTKLYGIHEFQAISALGLDIDPTKANEILNTTLEQII